MVIDKSEFEEILKIHGIIENQIAHFSLLVLGRFTIFDDMCTREEKQFMYSLYCIQLQPR